MRVHMPYLTQGEIGRHRAVRPRYLDIAWTGELVGHRREVAALPRTVLNALHRADDARHTERIERPGGLGPINCTACRPGHEIHDSHGRTPSTKSITP
jgi:hypothetical protein